MLLLGDCVEVLKTIPDNSVDSAVTDPPYELGFMGKSWDNKGIAYSVDMWLEVLRVLKPGGHLLAFGGTRTYHRMACAIEDAGFEIRDQMQWIYGSGFPKSYNISKGIDKMAGEVGDIKCKNPAYRPREYVWNQGGGKTPMRPEFKNFPATPSAIQWDGWGSALKPANEPICVARKPLSEKSIVENVLRWGVGGINVDGCRIGGDVITTNGGDKFKGDGIYNKYATCEETTHQGRFPANIIFDEEAGRMLDEMSGNASRFFYSPKASRSERNAGLEGMEEKPNNSYGEFKGTPEHAPKIDVRKQNHHPTVKPISLTRYLCRLVTPPKGTVLDPFMGSGTTGCAASLEGFEFIGIEREAEYMEIAERRIAHYQKQLPIPF